MDQDHPLRPKAVPEDEEVYSLCLIFSLNDERPGALANVLKIFDENQVNLLHIESRSSPRPSSQYEFFVECDSTKGHVDSAIDQLKTMCRQFIKYSKNYSGNLSTSMVPWFPRRIRDLGRYASRTLSYGLELDSEHPGFTDKIYRSRRKYFSDIAMNYEHGQPLPRLEYTKEEIETWSVVFKRLTTLYETHACKEYNHCFPLLVDNCGYRADNIPQLEDVSNFLKDSTGFVLRPSPGLLSPRDYFAALAFRVFYCTQYIRHPGQPFYTPEPDLCHELLGHVPMLADPSFAQFSQEIGLASLGASDEYIEKLGTNFWFTFEFGLCRQDGELKAYGGGLLSSYGELEYCLSDIPVRKQFDPEEAGSQGFPITEYQPLYYIAESFDDAKEKLRKYFLSVPRPFDIRYNAYTQSIELLDKKAGN